MTGTTRLLLRYPNGRTHEEVVPTPAGLALGLGFDLHGRHWLVVERMTASSRYGDSRPGLVCEPSPPPVAAPLRQRG